MFLAQGACCNKRIEPRQAWLAPLLLQPEAVGRHIVRQDLVYSPRLELGPLHQQVVAHHLATILVPWKTCLAHCEWQQRV